MLALYPSLSFTIDVLPNTHPPTGGELKQRLHPAPTQDGWAKSGATSCCYLRPSQCTILLVRGWRFSVIECVKGLCERLKWRCECRRYDLKCVLSEAMKDCNPVKWQLLLHWNLNEAWPTVYCVKPLNDRVTDPTITYHVRLSLDLIFTKSLC